MDEKEFLKQFGREIAARRVKLGLSQEELAEKVSSNQNYLSGIETGKANPSLLYIKKLASALDIELCDLLKF